MSTVETDPPPGRNTVMSAGGMDAVSPADGNTVRSTKSVKPPKLVRVRTHVSGTLGGVVIEGGAQSIAKSLRFEKAAPALVSELGEVVPLDMVTQTPLPTLVVAQSAASTAKSIEMPGVDATTL